MNVAREIAAADRRIQRQIDASARQALIRLGFDPDAEARAAQIEAWTAIGVALGQAMVQLGQLADAALTAFAGAVEALEAETDAVDQQIGAT